MASAQHPAPTIAAPSAGPASPTVVRRERLRALLRDRGLDGLLVTDLVNVRYLTGFTGSNAAVLVMAADDADIGDAVPDDAGSSGPGSGSGAADGDRTRFCTDGRYTTQSAAEVPDLPRLIGRPVDTALLRTAAAGVIGFEADAVSVSAHGTLRRVVDDRGGDVELTSTSGLVEELRAIKDPGEINALLRACGVADQAFAELIEAGGIRPGRTEREVGLDLDQRMRVLGASDPSFETIVATGANSAIPHHRPTAAVLGAGDLVKFDFGATVDGYHSDMTRTVVLGEPADWQREIHDLVLAAQRAGRDACVVGAHGSDVDRASRDVIVDAGYGDRFTHGLGHGVGLQVHEAPSLAAGSASIMAADMCVTVEPGVYLPGRGGVRIEDSGVVGPDGYLVLTLTARELRIL